MDDVKRTVDHAADNGLLRDPAMFSSLAERWAVHCVRSYNGSLRDAGLRISGALADFEDEMFKGTDMPTREERIRARAEKGE